MRHEFSGETGMSKLLQLLADGRFHSGQALGQALEVSRSAVWKQIQRLQSDYGLEVESVRGMGYRLVSPLSLLCSQEAVGPWPVRILQSVDSTNLEALRYLQSGVGLQPLCIVAERQQHGRGRRGRTWLSPFAENIYLSLALPIEGGSKQLDGLSLTVGLAVQRALAQYQIADLGLKWPNDILAGGAKLGGILLELHGDPAGQCAVVIGIGVNVNMLRRPEIDQGWTSLRLLLGRLVDRDEVLRRIGVQLDIHLQRHWQGGFAALRDAWGEVHAWQGREVNLISGCNQVRGTVAGVDNRGGLLLSVGGEVKTYNGGELSLRLSDDS